MLLLPHHSIPPPNPASRTAPANLSPPAVLLRRHLLRAASPLPASSLTSLSRLLSTTAAAASTSADLFAVEDYLVTTCHLTPAQALKASKYLSHLKSPSKPDAVVAFLAGIGLSTADIAAAVSADPRLLCARVDQTLQPRAAELRDLGLSPSEIARLVPLARFRCANCGRNLRFLLSVFGSFDVALKVVKTNFYALHCNVEKVLKPNISLLKQCGLRVCDIANRVNSLLALKPEALEAIVANAENLGVPRSSRMFRHALLTYRLLSPERIAARLEFLKNLGWSEAELGVAVRKFPQLLRISEEKLRRSSEFLTDVVGLELAYVARRPSLLAYSIERRLAPRLYVIRALRTKGLLKGKCSFYGAACKTDKMFLEKFVRPHRESVPGLAETYAAACAGKCRLDLEALCEKNAVTQGRL